MDPQESQKAWGKVVAKAWSDELFKKRVFADPKTVLKEHGIEVPPELTVKIVENSAKVEHLVLPARPDELGELSLEELELVAGGWTVKNVVGTVWAALGGKPPSDTGGNAPVGVRG